MKVHLDTDLNQKTYIALKNLVDNSWYMQTQAYEEGLHQNCSSFLNEFCTVKMCTARRSGHSTAMVRLCCEYFNKAVIFLPTEKMIDNIGQLFRPYVDNITDQRRSRISINNGESEYHICTNTNQIRGVEAEAIFVDCASFISSAKMEDIEAVAKGCLRPPAPFFLIYVE